MKLDQKKDIKRLAIYFFYDDDGVVDRYVLHMLDAVKRNCSDLFIVCNGKLNQEGRKLFLQYTPDLLVRENEGYDVGAFQEALEQKGWDEISEYDELILLDYTIMGPVYPFEEMFREMDGRDVDFWGITNSYDKILSGKNISERERLEHRQIQTHFIAVRNALLKGREFKRYWKKLPEIKTLSEAVGYFEGHFTETFRSAGYSWAVYTDCRENDDFVDKPLLMDPVRMIRDHKCPVFQKYTFTADYHEYLLTSAGSQPRELMTYLKNETDYDTGMIWEHIIRVANMATIKHCLGLNYILPKDYSEGPAVNKKVALVIHAYFEDLVDYCYNYALSMPDSSDIYITVGSEKIKKLVEEKFLKGPWNDVKIIMIENIGRDVSALLVGAAPYLQDYDYVCFMHDKKVTQMDMGIKGYVFSERCFQNMLGSKEYVNNILTLFENEPYLGLLCPPPPNHADYYPILSLEWGPNFEATAKVAKRLNLSCKMSPDLEPIAPLGTMFWFRPEAMKVLLDYGWKYSDIPKEPINTDGTVLHAIERIYAFVVQDAGYYCAWGLNDQYARTEWNNLSFMLRNLNIRDLRLYGNNNHYGLINNMDYYYENLQQNNNLPVFATPNVRMLIKESIRKKIPKPIWNAIKKVYIFFGGKKWRYT